VAHDEDAGAATRVDPDADLLDLVHRGKRDAALRMLMQRHGRAVYRFCHESLPDKPRADDVHQRVFIEAHRDLPRFQGRSLVKTWLFAIARHRIMDERKAHHRAARHLEHDEAHDIADATASPDEQLDDARLREALVICVAELAPDIREAVLLRFEHAMTFDQMAEICREKAGTLQARVARAMTKLGQCIARRTGDKP
jgi:RNA polymerase sigma-70 factor (ECF subfamily)